MTSTQPVAEQLADWATAFRPAPGDVALAERALLDTTAVTLAARGHPTLTVARRLSEAGFWATAAHVLDFDDLHMQSTAHISAVCVPATLAAGGDEVAYLAAAGVMARLGMLLGWQHYRSGWHATCTAGAVAAAVAAARSWNLSSEQTQTAIALAVPGAGGVRRAFGTDAKSLQVAFAVEAGLRAATLAADGAHADPTALDQWLQLVGARGHLDLISPAAIPGGLAIKMYPCCYALQRPISAISELAGTLDPATVTRIVVRTPESAVAPLIHHRPTTGLEAKFSFEYAIATGLLDHHQGFQAFSDAAVQRREAQRLINTVEIRTEPGGNWLLEGTFDAELHLSSGNIARCQQQYPPAAPDRPPSEIQLEAKIADCLLGLSLGNEKLTWSETVTVLRRWLPSQKAPRSGSAEVEALGTAHPDHAL